ncbi:hypothetical protein PRIPAC_77046 [Pristionchus pacificus]|uniref:Uncharacterized protein n=1 Tax=Pristionchus pacificus TaxID=54126 RepID=A0A2A6CNB0_PRIPA|nr:hypothetical protein PRIPAC_77046 [Pristionchus pacificus]|eukprot:PDM79684.1 hypothetical protein PRIPAC_32263 [Pristionchus pacificus]
MATESAHEPSPAPPSRDISSIEQLPRELIALIVGHAPEAVFEMRLSCRMLKSAVDEYARRPCDIPIVRRIVFNEMKNTWLSIPKSRTALFELRLVLHQPALKLRMQRHLNGPENPSQYCIETTSLPEDAIDGLRECVGTRIREASFPDYDEPLCKLIDGIQIEKLKAFIDLRQEAAGERLLKNLRSHKVNELYLTVREVKLANPADFLLDISTIVRTLFISQLYVDDKDQYQRHFLGIDDFNWAPVIIGMFERRLDTMHVRTAYPSYFTLQSADDIRLKLPLLGRKIWFETRCNAYDRHEVRLDYVTNDHSVRALRWTPVTNALSIKHCSRESERHHNEFF